MRKLYLYATASLWAMALRAPDTGSSGGPDRGLNASLEAGGGDPGTTVETPSRPAIDRGLTASLRAEEANFSATGQQVTDFEVPLSGKVVPVHKQGEEGLLMIDAVSGWVIRGQEDRPAWSDGLITAILGERHIFYANRLGSAYTEDHKMPEVLAFEDLPWMALNMETGEQLAYEADAEFRMDVVAEVLGINRSIEGDHDIKGNERTVVAEISYDNTRTGEQMAAFTEAQGKHFEDVSKTGTAG